MLTGPHIKKLNFDRCDHKVLGTCSTETEGCCGVVACNLCIQITSDYTELVVDRKVAPFSSPGYAATLGVVVFEAYWRRDYTTDECVFIVEVTDAVETQVLEFSKCYDAASCMAPAGSVAIQYDGKPHVLSWEPSDIVTLKHRVEGECKKPFCGECTCAPREICVTLTIGGCTVSELVGLEPSECKEEEPPVWEFTLVCPDGGPTVSGTVSLLREEYTNACILNVVIPAHYIDVDYEWLECPLIDDIVVPFTIGYENASVTIRSADCDMCITKWGICYCGPDNIVETIKVSIFSGLHGLTPLGEVTMHRALLPVPGCANSTLDFPIPCQGFYGQATLMFPIGMGEYEENSIELRLYCATDCGQCFEHRFGTGDIDFPYRGWIRNSIQSEFIECIPRFSSIAFHGGCHGYEENYIWKIWPNPLEAGCFGNLNYQISEFLLEQKTP